MHAALLLLPAAALAARTSQIWREKQQDQSWSYRPDRTADWYNEVGLPLPDVAPEVTSDGSSYYVKLPCLGCPFRLRKYLEPVETWQEPPQDNSLLLNFTINEDKSGLLLNGEPVLPLESPPPALRAFQIPANTSQEIMSKMIDQHMMDSSWVLGTKYGRFELQYEHSLLATEEPTEQLLQFDVTGVHIRFSRYPGSYSLDKEGQKMIQVRLSRDPQNPMAATLQDVQVIERKDKQEPLTMPCGKPAILRTVYDPREWDSYGKFGTWSRTWRKTVGETVNWLDRNGLLLIILSVGLGIFSLVRWRQQRAEKKATAVQIMEDSEAALLAQDQNDDAPPAYSDIPPAENLEQELKAADE